MVKMLDTYNNLSQKNIEDFEPSNSIELTDHYKRSLLRWNGGTPYVGVFMITEEEGPSVMNYFYSIGDPDNDVADSVDSYDLRLRKGFIAIGEDQGGNGILME